MVTENIVHKKYRILIDDISDIWDRISFWRAASDIELSSGTDLETDLAEKQTKINANQTNLAQVENTNKATHVYTKGQLLVNNNQLYRVIAAIAVGNTLTVGTNIQAMSISNLSSMLTASTGIQFYFDYKDGKPGFYPNANKTASEFVPIA